MQRYREKQTIQNFMAIFCCFRFKSLCLGKAFSLSGRMDISLVKHNCPVPLALRNYSAPL